MEAPPTPDYIPGPKAPPSPDYISGPEVPPLPDYIPGPEAPPSPDYIPGPKYPEYLPPADDVLPTEEQPLPVTVSPTAESLGYITESEPEMEPEEEDGDDEKSEDDFIEYPTSRGDNDADDDGDDLSDDDADDEDEEESSDSEEEKEEQLALTVPAPALYSSVSASEETEPFEEGEKVERLLAIPTPPLSPVSPTSYPLPPLLMPLPIFTPLPTSSFPLPLPLVDMRRLLTPEIIGRLRRERERGDTFAPCLPLMHRTLLTLEIIVLSSWTTSSHERSRSYMVELPCEDCYSGSCSGIAMENLKENDDRQELALMCDRTFPEESDRVEKYIGGVPDTIHDSVKAAKPKIMQEAIKFATELMDKRIRNAVENKRKFEGNSDRNMFTRRKPLYSKCDYHHEGPCPPRCNNCKRIGHLARDSRSRPANANNNNNHNNNNNNNNNNNTNNNNYNNNNNNQKGNGFC
nr:hypothetical protein [Tanacetum cinerariifolium]